MGCIDNQKDGVKAILLKRGSITPTEAIKEVGTQRLSAIIHTLRHKEGWAIDTVICTGKTRFGHVCNYAKYVLKESEDDE